MATTHCSVCGQVLPDSDVKGGGHSAATAATCSACLKKLGAKEASTRTTILRPPGSLQVDGKAILGPALEAPEPRSGIASLDERAADSSVALRLVAGEAGGGQDAQGLTKKFGNYEILGEISRGSFGVVYKARQPGLDRIVALKVLLAGAYASAEAVARFQREAKAVARLKHPNIVPVYDIGIYEGHHYFAMEFVEGQSLSDLIKKKLLSTSQALVFAEALSDAVESAHKAGVIHRDIKPSNILVDQEGRPHITDFGLAKQVDLDTKYTVSGTTLGTPAYMPPEQARGEIEKIDARSDVYSIGAVLYEMLTGETPFAGRSLLEVVVAVINQPVRPPRQFNPKLNHDIQTMVMKCLEKDPRQRYQSAAELRDDIRRFRGGETIRAKPASFFRVAGRFVKRHAPLLGAAAIVLFAMGYATIWVQKSKKIIAQKEEKVVLKEKNLDEEKKKIEADEIKRKTPEWRPVWWFPPKPSSDLYKALPDKDYEKLKDMVLPAVANLPQANALVSPEEFFGDLDMDFVFDLNEAGIANGLRLGLQSADKTYNDIPFLAEIKSGVMTLIGPVDLCRYTNPPPPPGKATQLKLETKAEKETPPPASGRYTLNIHRHGIDLSLRLTCAKPEWKCGLEIRDVNLSSWAFKRTQFVVRGLAGNGLIPVSGEVRARFGGEENEAFKDFYTGEYDDAKKRLNVLAEGEDCFVKARALDKLGLLEEIFNPGQSPAAHLYSDALEALAKVRDPKLALLRDDLAKELQVRKVIGLARDRQKNPAEMWGDFKDELVRTWKNEEKIGEPLAWEFQGVLEQLLNEAPEKIDTGIKLDVGLAVFQRLGLPPGGPRLGKSARELAALLTVKNRFDDLVALHNAYPSAALHDAFFEAVSQTARNNQLAEGLRLVKYLAPLMRGEAEKSKLAAVSCAVAETAVRLHKYAEAGEIISLLRAPKLLAAACEQVERQLKEAGGEGFDQFRTVLLPVMQASLPADAGASAGFAELMEKMALALAAAGRPDDIRKLHAALRGPETKSDPRLAGAFASAIAALLAKANDPEAETAALELLKYCGEHVAANDPGIKAAALLLARRKAVVDDQRSYGTLLIIQQAYPAPEFLELALGVMRQLLERQRYEEAVLFYNQARVAFWTTGGGLTAWLVGALNGITSEELRSRLLSAVKNTVQGELEDLKNDAAGRQWRLEYGDIELALNYWEKARQTYQQLLALPKTEPALLAQTGLRLAALYYLHPNAAPPGALLPPLLETANMPEEMKLALRLLGTPERLSIDELVAQRRGLAPPLLLTGGEWDLLCGLRLLMDHNSAIAFPLLQEADRQAGAAAVWVHALAAELSRPEPRSPDEQK